MDSVRFVELISADNVANAKYQNERESVMSDIVSGRIGINEIARIPLKYLDLTRLPGVPEQNVMTPSKAFKPFRYEFGYKVWELQNQMHWLHHPVNLNKDLQDWKQKLNDAERNLMKHMFPLFVQNDVMVGNAYVEQYAKIFKPVDLQLAITAIANAEGVHQVAYSHLLTELGFGESHYSAFLEYQEMNDKYDFTKGFRMDTLMGIAVAMLVFGAFTEGLQLFASFATLFNFPRQNKLVGMGQIVSWSVKDEDLHVAFVAQLFKVFMAEFGHLLDKKTLADAGNNAVRTIVQNEHRFADLAFELGPVEGMTKHELKDYVSFMADYRLDQFGMPKLFNVTNNPFEDWIDGMMGGVEHANLFEVRGTSYSKDATTGSWADAFAKDEPLLQ
jgi:ribonucleoside-diphosphate reductase beta chain